MKIPVCTILGMDSKAGIKMARYYHQKGFHIALVDWSRSLLESNQELLRKEFEEVNAFIIEGNDYTDIQYAFQKVYAHLGATEVLIYNKSVTGKQLGDYTSTVFDELRRNLFTAGYAIDQVIPSMKHSKKGEIVFVGYEFDMCSTFNLGKSFVENMVMEQKNNHINLIASVRGQFKSLTKMAKNFPYKSTKNGNESKQVTLPPFLYKPAIRY